MEEDGENGGVRRSATEPSTPLRNIIANDSQNGNYTNPTHSNISNIHLPRNELTEVTKRLSNQFRGSVTRPRSKLRVRPSTPRRDTPTRGQGSRTASEVIRRRRSSMITDKGELVYGSEYAGPITIDYLRFFCKVVIKQQEYFKESNQPNQPIVPNESHTLRGSHMVLPRVTDYTSPKKDSFVSPFLEVETTPKVSTEFDQSLPLPSSTEKLLKSPFQITSNLDQTENHVTPTTTRRYETNVDNSSDKENETMAKPLSYLEKILLSKRLKRKSDVTFPELEDRAIHGDEIDSPIKNEFVIHPGREKEVEDVYSRPERGEGLEVPDENVQPEDTDFHIAYDVLDEQAHVFDNDADDDHVHHGVPNEFPESPVVENEQGKLAISPIVTPENAGLDFNNGYFPEALIQEEFTMQDDVGNYSELLEKDNSDGIDDGTEEYDGIGGETNGKLINIPSIKPTSTRSSKSSLPLQSVKNLVRSIRIHSIRDDNSDHTLKKQKVLKTIPQNVYQNIQEKSDQFLKSLLMDLEAYAQHRSNGKSSQISMKDIQLYLNRIKFAGKSDSRDTEINKISRLAQNFLPLELLLQLNDSVSGQLKGSTDNEVEEDVEYDDSFDDSI